MMRNTFVLLSVLLPVAQPAQAQVAADASRITADRTSNDTLDGGYAGDGRRPVMVAPIPTDEATAKERARPRAVTAKDESIYVIQRRSYSKSGKLEVTPLFFTALNPKFVGYIGAAASVAYHARENLAFELISSIPYANYVYYSNLVAEVYSYEGLTPEDVDLKRMTFFTGASLQFSALYGKVRFYEWLMDYDFYVGAGLGYVTTIETCNPDTESKTCSKKKDIGRGFRSPEQGIDRHKIAGNLAGGMRFFFADALGVRVEVRDIAYADRALASNGTSTDIRNNLLLFMGLSLML